VSTAGGGERRAGAPPPGEPIPFEPGLDHLISALTASGHPHERAGRDAALAAFRSASQAASQQPRQRGFSVRGSAGRRGAVRAGRPVRLRMPAWLVSVAAAGFAVLAGFTAAAYAQALPAPVQHIAYSVLAPLGVPNSEPQSGAPNTPSPGASHPAAAATVSGAASPGGGACPCPGQAARTAAPTAAPLGAGHYAITVTVASVQVPANARDLVTGEVSRHGQPAAGVKIRLLERTAGSSSWLLAASGVTGSRGAVRLWSPPLTARAVFRLAGPDGARSAAVTVKISSPVRLRLAPGPVKDRLIVAAPGAGTGDVVQLMELVSGAWQLVASEPLGPRLRAVFALPIGSAAGHLYRADVFDSTASTSTPSNLVWVPRRAGSGAKAIQPSPSQSPAPSPSPSTTPTPQPSPPTGATPSPSPTSSTGASQGPTAPTTPVSSSDVTTRAMRQSPIQLWGKTDSSTSAECAFGSGSAQASAHTTTS
jgi:hypothetical protein